VGTPHAARSARQSRRHPRPRPARYSDAVRRPGAAAPDRRRR
jgi:hypothetical protein